MRLGGSVAAKAVSQPGHGGEHSEPAQNTHEPADFLVLVKQAPLSEKNRPVTLLRADERQRRSASVGHVCADVRKVFKEPEAAKSKAGRFPLPEEIDGAKDRNEQLTERAAKNHDGVAEPTEEEMPALVNHQIDVIEDEKSGAVGEGIQKEKYIETKPGNAGAARHRIPLSQFVFEDGHRHKRNKANRRKATVVSYQSLVVRKEL